MAKRELSSNVRKLRFMQSNNVEKKRIPMKPDQANSATNDISGADIPWRLDTSTDTQNLQEECTNIGIIKGVYKVRYHTRRSLGGYNKIIDQFEKRTDDLLLKHNRKGD